MEHHNPESEAMEHHNPLSENRLKPVVHVPFVRCTHKRVEAAKKQRKRVKKETDGEITERQLGHLLKKK